MSWMNSRCCSQNNNYCPYPDKEGDTSYCAYIGGAVSGSVPYGGMLGAAFPFYGPIIWHLGTFDSADTSDGLIDLLPTCTGIFSCNVWESGTYTSTGRSWYWRLTITGAGPGGVVLEKMYLTHPDSGMGFPMLFTYTNLWQLIEQTTAYTGNFPSVKLFIDWSGWTISYIRSWQGEAGCSTHITPTRLTTPAPTTDWNYADVLVEGSGTISKPATVTIGVDIYDQVCSVTTLPNISETVGLRVPSGRGSTPIWILTTSLPMNFDQYTAASPASATLSFDPDCLTETVAINLSGSVSWVGTCLGVDLTASDTLEGSNVWASGLPYIISDTATTTRDADYYIRLTPAWRPAAGSDPGAEGYRLSFTPNTFEYMVRGPGGFGFLVDHSGPTNIESPETITATVTVTLDSMWNSAT